MWGQYHQMLLKTVAWALNHLNKSKSSVDSCALQLTVFVYKPPVDSKGLERLLFVEHFVN